MAAQSSSDRAAAAVSVPAALISASPRAHLHRHALESIFGFLALADLASASRVSKDWSARTLSMAPLRCTFVPALAHRVQSVCASRFARHLQSFHVKVAAFLTAADLSLLSAAAPQLTALTVAVEPSPSRPLHFPPLLRSLHLTSWSDHSSGLHLSITAIAALRHVQTLYLRFPSVAELQQQQLDFTPLQRMPALQSLCLRAAEDWTTQQLDQVRAMPHLTTIDVGPTSAMLELLLRRPHALQWEEVVLLYLWPSISDLLAALPLQRMGAEETPVHVLGSIACLHALGATLRRLHLNFVLAQLDPSEVAAALCCCVHLTDLGVYAGDMQPEHMLSVLRSTPDLKSLLLRGTDRINSLSFLAAAGVPLLESFKLKAVRHVGLEDISSLRHQTRLRTLSLLQSFGDEGLPEDTLQAMRPPSAWFPMLTAFEAPKGMPA